MTLEELAETVDERAEAIAVAFARMMGIDLSEEIDDDEWERRLVNCEELPGLTENQQARMNGIGIALREIRREIEDRDPEGPEVETTIEKIQHEMAREALEDVSERIMEAAHNIYAQFMEINEEDGDDDISDQ